MNQNLKLGNISFFVIILQLFAQINTVYLQVDQQPICIWLEPLQNTKYKFNYQSVFKDSTLQVSVENQVMGRFQLYGKGNQTFLNAEKITKVCFKTNKSIEPVIVDFYPQQKQKLKSLALKSDMQEVHMQVIQAGNSIRNISHFAKFQQQIEILHAQFIQKHQKSMKIYATLKIIVAFVVFLLQFWFVKRLISSS